MKTTKNYTKGGKGLTNINGKKADKGTRLKKREERKRTKTTMMASRERGRAARRGVDISGMSDLDLRRMRENRRATRAASALSALGALGAVLAGGRNVKQ